VIKTRLFLSGSEGGNSQCYLLIDGMIETGLTLDQICFYEERGATVSFAAQVENAVHFCATSMPTSGEFSHPAEPLRILLYKNVS
jgi:hypothetical protein